VIGVDAAHTRDTASRMRSFVLLFALAGCAARAVPAEEAPETDTSPVLQGPPPLAPAMGVTLGEALQHEYFQFFGWTEARRETLADATVVVHYATHPESDFAGLVRMRVQVGGQDRILGLELELQRSFVHGASAVFARDIAKSFVRAAAPASDAPAMNAFSDELWEPDLERPSDALRAYAGLLPRHDLGVLRVETMLHEDGEWVRMTVRPGGARHPE
jgi:hypothetical protein